MDDQEREGFSSERRYANRSNQQIDEILEEGYDSYTRNLDQRLSTLARRQTRLLDQLYDEIEKNEKERIKQSFNDRQDEMRKSLADWRENYKAIRKDLTLSDRFAADVFYWNRRRNLRDLEREARYRFSDIADDAKDAAEDINDSFSTLSDSLRDWGNALNLNRLANGLEEVTDSSREIRIEIQKHLALTDEQWQDMKQNAIDFSKETDYAISNLEFLSNARDLVVNLGFNDADLAMQYAQFTAKLEQMTGKTSEDMESFIYTTLRDGFAGAEDVRQVYSQIMALEQDPELWGGVDDWVNMMNENNDLIYKIARGDHDAYMNLLNQTQAMYASTNMNQLNGVDELMTSILNGSYSDMGNSQYWLQLGATQISSMASSGDLEGAYELLINNLHNQLSDVYNRSGGSIMALNEWIQNLGISDLGIDDQTLTDLAMNDNLVNEAMDTYNYAMSRIEDQIESDNKFIDTWDPEVTWSERLANRWKSSWIGDKLDTIFDNIDMTFGEVLTYAGATAQVLSFFKGGKGAGLLGGLGKLFGGANTAAGASATSGLGASGGAGFLSSLSNFFTAGFGGAGANTAAGQLGMNILGFGAEGGMATLGTGGAMSAGLLTTAATGIGGLAMMGIDAYHGVENSEEWLGSDSLGAKIASGAGAALGGTGPGWFDGGSLGDTALNTAGGAGKGALIGAAIGSIVPGLGTAIGAAVGAGVGAVGAAIGGEKISQAIDWVGEKANDMWNGVKDFGVDAFNTVVGGADLLMDGLFEDLGLDWTDFKDSVSQGFSDMIDWASSTWSDIKQGAADLWDGVTDWASGAWEDVKTAASDTWEDIKTTGQAAADAIAEAYDNSIIKKGIDGVGDLLNGAWNGLTGMLNGARAHGEEITGISGSHELGLREVPYDGYIAELHEGEAVLTKAQANDWRQNSYDQVEDANDQQSDWISRLGDYWDQSYLGSFVNEKLLPAVAKWAPSDKTETFSAGDTIIINNQVTETEPEEFADDDEASNDDVIKALKEVSKDIQKAIAKTSQAYAQSQQDMQRTMSNVLSSRRSSTAFSLIAGR